jgi:hypothetical protein
LAHPLDDFIEARTEGPDDHKILDAMKHEIEAIVSKYGGLCYEWGPIERNYVPFSLLFMELTDTTDCTMPQRRCHA